MWLSGQGELAGLGRSVSFCLATLPFQRQADPRIGNISVQSLDQVVGKRFQIT